MLQAAAKSCIAPRDKPDYHALKIPARSGGDRAMKVRRVTLGCN
jgi:hypothetical protein